MKSFISSRGASPECTCTGSSAAWQAAHTGSYAGSLYGARSRHIVGIMIPRMPGLSASHSISATARSMSWQIGTRPTPPRRFGTRRAQLDEKAVVRARAGERELGIFDHARREPGTERRRLHAGDRVGVGEDHLGGDAVGVHLLVALLGVERAAQAFFVRRSPSRDVVVVQLHLQRRGSPGARRGTRRTRRGTARRGTAGTPRTASRRARRPR